MATLSICANKGNFDFGPNEAGSVGEYTLAICRFGTKTAPRILDSLAISKICALIKGATHCKAEYQACLILGIYGSKKNAS